MTTPSGDRVRRAEEVEIKGDIEERGVKVERYVEVEREEEMDEGVVVANTWLRSFRRR